MQIQRQNLSPALEWVRQHDAQLRGPGGEPSAFEFSLHRLAFLSLLKREGQAAAVAYARQHFGRFRASQVGGEGLGCCCCFCLCTYCCCCCTCCGCCCC